MKLPYTYKIGITGHRRITNPDTVTDMLHQVLTQIHDCLEPVKKHHHLDLKLHMYSALADGADRLAVHALRKFDRYAAYTAVLPLPEKEYEKDFTTTETLQDFQNLLKNAANVIGYKQEQPVTERSHCYLEVGKKIVFNSDVIIAVWNEEKATGTGGTGDIVDYCKIMNKPYFVINPISGQITKPAEHLKAQSAEELALLNNIHKKEYHHIKNYDRLKNKFPEIEAYNVLLNKVDALAAKYQTWFFRIQHMKILCALLATSFAGLGLGLLATGSELVEYTHYAELVLVLIILAGYQAEKHYETQGKWIQFRLLAEKLRITIVAYCCGMKVFNLDNSVTGSLIFRLKEYMNMNLASATRQTIEEKKNILLDYLTRNPAPEKGQQAYHQGKMIERRNDIKKTEMQIKWLLGILLFCISLSILISYLAGVYKFYDPAAWFGLIAVFIPTYFTYCISLENLREHKKLLGMNTEGYIFFQQVNFELDRVTTDQMVQDIIIDIERFMTNDTLTWLKLYEAEKNDLA